MRQAEIYFKGELAGILTQLDNGCFTYEYDDLWMSDNNKPPISLTLPKKKKEYKSNHLFPFFYNMLPEGANKRIVCKHMRIDNKDFFSLLLITACYDTIGAVTVRKI
ncbi:MAG: HipA N-terminal domain-containing protein [Cyclobacteriaceae bacterium]